ncbi:MAG: proline racemase family protein [bacterium]
MKTDSSTLRKPMINWRPPDQWVKIVTVDAHSGGEPLRIIIDGYPELPGGTILEQRRFAKEKLDFLRTALMWEPRGHHEMYGCIITSPVSTEADFGILFLHNEGYSTMCGHGIIAVSMVAAETGLVKVKEPETIIRIDAPAGLITAHAKVSEGRVQSVAFRNVPSFVMALDETIQVPGLGTIRYDLAFGGAFYAFVQADQVGLSCRPEEYAELVEKGMAIKRAVMNARPIIHPFENDLSFLYGTIFIAPPIGPGADSRNVCIFADGEVDRSPTGTGVSARMAIHFARKQIVVGQPLTIESIIGSRFIGRVVRKTTFEHYDAIIPEVEGTAFMTGRNEFWIDPDDPFRNGFLI